MMFYMYAKGTKTGDVKGSVTQKGRENSCLCSWYDMGVDTPTDKMSGFAAGKRIHRLFQVRKEIDAATPLFFQMATTNEVLKSVIFKYWRVGTGKIGTTGQETQHYTIELDNARIAALRQYTPEHQASETGNQHSTHDVEELGFVYQKITVTWTQGGITATDDWESPNV
ncbi:MAG: type VI secretion system tube protein TssD [Polyangiaceae bacterium]